MLKQSTVVPRFLFESEDGSVESNIEEELPFDVTAKEIVLEDDDFGLWYLDVSEHRKNTRENDCV